MPAVQPPAKVLVSGATGYIAAWVVQNLLERGYTVRGTARSVTKGNYLKKLFASYGDRLEVVAVPDIANDGAFDEAVKGVDAVEHIASPVPLEAVDIDELIRPAVNGTVGMLTSILKDESTQVKRVVITSSAAAVLHEGPNPTTFSEADWNDECLEVLKKYEDEGRRNEVPNNMRYRASKTLAERAAWEFMSNNKTRIGWDLVTLIPPYVYGPAIHEVTSPTSLNASAIQFYKHVADGAKANAAGNKFLANKGTCWIDVRDLAGAHVLALEKPAAGGERIIVHAGPWKWQDFIDAANDLSPPPKLKTTLPVGVRGAGKTAQHLTLFDATKADRILGLRYRTIAETTRDTLYDYEARGW